MFRALLKDSGSRYFRPFDMPGRMKNLHMVKRTLFALFFIWALFFFGGFAPIGKTHAQEAKKILSIEAYDMLNTVPDTYLIDVRTREEYQFVGHPQRGYLFPYMFMTSTFAKENSTYGYQFSPKNKAFLEEIGKVFKKTDNILVISRPNSPRSRTRIAINSTDSCPNGTRYSDSGTGATTVGSGGDSPGPTRWIRNIFIPLM